MATDKWRNRIVGYGAEDPANLLAHPDNWRVHPERQQAALSSIMEHVGVVQNVIVNRRTGHLVDGHLRVTLAMRNNVGEIPVTYVDLTPVEEATILASLDPVGTLAFTDREKLDALLDEVRTHDAALTDVLDTLYGKVDLTGFSTDFLNDAANAGDPATVWPDAPDRDVNKFVIPVSADERTTIMETIRAVKKTVEEVTTTTEAIVYLCEAWGGGA